jgi:2,3-diaminopropionate biosynthesis protein SbnA
VSVGVAPSLRQRLGLLRAALPVTPVMRLPHDNIDLYAKIEYVNPTGSTKDRSAFWILKQAVDRGELTEGSTVVESSSGNFAISLATFCRTLHIPFVPVIDPYVNRATEAFLRAACARVEKVTEPDGSGGYLHSRLSRVRELRAEIDGAYWPNQYANGDAAAAHYRFTGGELCAAFARIDYVFIGVSSGGTIAGLSRRLKERDPRVRTVGVDAEGSAVFGQRPGRRRIPGLGSSIVPAMLEQAIVDDVEIVSESETVTGCHALLREYGLFGGGSTGSVFAAIQRYFRRKPPAGRPTVVFVCADYGAGYLDTVYNPEWVAGGAFAESMPSGDEQVAATGTQRAARRLPHWR